MRYLLFFFIVLFLNPTFAQIEFTDDFTQQNLNKPQFIYLTAASSANIQHRYFNRTILQDRRMGDLVNQNFNCFTLNPDIGITKKLTKQHQLASSEGILFLDAKGNFIYHQKHLPSTDLWESKAKAEFLELLTKIEQLAELKYVDPIKIWADTVSVEIASKQIMNLIKSYDDYCNDLYNHFIQKEEIQQLPKVVNLSIEILKQRNQTAAEQFAKHPKLYKKALGKDTYDSLALDLASSRAWDQANTSMTMEEILKVGEESHSFFNLDKKRQKTWAIEFLLGYDGEMRMEFDIPSEYLLEVFEYRLKMAETNEEKIDAYYHAIWNITYAKEKPNQQTVEQMNKWITKMAELGLEKEKIDSINDEIKAILDQK